MKTFLKVIGFIIALPLALCVLVLQFGTQTVYAVDGLLSPENFQTIVEDVVEEIDFGDLLLSGETPLIDDETLSGITAEMGIPKESIQSMLNSESFNKTVGAIASSVVSGAFAGDVSSVISQEDFTKLLNDNIDDILAAGNVNLPPEQVDALIDYASSNYDEIVGMLGGLIEQFQSGGGFEIPEGFELPEGFEMPGGVSVDGPKLATVGAPGFFDTVKAFFSSAFAEINYLIDVVTGKQALPTEPMALIGLATCNGVKLLLIGGTVVLFLLISLFRGSLWKGMRFTSIMVAIPAFMFASFGLVLFLMKNYDMLLGLLPAEIKAQFGMYISAIVPLLKVVGKRLLLNGGIALGVAIVVIIFTTIIIKANKKKRKAREEAKKAAKLNPAPEITVIEETNEDNNIEETAAPTEEQAPETENQ